MFNVALANDIFFEDQNVLDTQTCVFPMTVHREQSMKREDQQDATIRCFRFL